MYWVGINFIEGASLDSALSIKLERAHILFQTKKGLHISTGTTQIHAPSSNFAH